MYIVEFEDEIKMTHLPYPTDDSQAIQDAFAQLRDENGAILNTTYKTLSDGSETPEKVDICHEFENGVTEVINVEKTHSSELTITISDSNYTYLDTNYRRQVVNSRMSNLEKEVDTIAPGAGGDQG